jgi:hypothetical protein
VSRQVFHLALGVTLVAFSATVVGGCGNAPASTPSAEVPTCRAPAARTTLYDGATQGPVGALWITGDQVLYSTSAGLWSVPLAGGATTEIAPAATGVAVVGGTLYYTAEHPVGTADNQGKQSSASALYAAPFAGGPIDPTTAVLVADNFTAGASTQDGSSLYLAGAGLGSVLKLTPPDTSVPLTFAGTLEIRALAVDDSHLYAAVEDLSAQPSQGLIVRMPKAGGGTDRLALLPGNPDGLAVDSGDLFWIQEPPSGTFGNSTIVRSNLAGQNVATLVDGSDASASDLALGPADLYFTAGMLERIGKQGGSVEPLTPALAAAGFLQVSGGDVVWVDNATRALSSTAPTTIETMCPGPSSGS